MWRATSGITKAELDSLTKDHLAGLPEWEPYNARDGGDIELLTVKLTEDKMRGVRPRLDVVPHLIYPIHIESGWAAADLDEVEALVREFSSRVPNVGGLAYMHICWAPAWSAQPVKKHKDVGTKSFSIAVRKDLQGTSDGGHQPGPDDIRVGFNFPLEIEGAEEEYRRHFEAFRRECEQIHGQTAVPLSQYLSPNAVTSVFEFARIEPWADALPRIRALLQNWSKPRTRFLVSMNFQGHTPVFGGEGAIVCDQYLAAMWGMPHPFRKMELWLHVPDKIFINPQWDVAASIFGRWAPAIIPLGSFEEEHPWQLTAELRDGLYTLVLKDKHSGDILPPGIAATGLKFEYTSASDKKRK